MPKGNSEFRVNPLETEYLEKSKNVRILLEEKFAGKHSFMEFAPYCDYHKSFAQIQPFNELELKEKKEEEGVILFGFCGINLQISGKITWPKCPHRTSTRSFYDKIRLQKCEECPGESKTSN